MQVDAIALAIILIIIVLVLFLIYPQIIMRFDLSQSYKSLRFSSVSEMMENYSILLTEIAIQKEMINGAFFLGKERMVQMVLKLTELRASMDFVQSNIDGELSVAYDTTCELLQMNSWINKINVIYYDEYTKIWNEYRMLLNIQERQVSEMGKNIEYFSHKQYDKISFKAYDLTCSYLSSNRQIMKEIENHTLLIYNLRPLEIDLKNSAKVMRVLQRYHVNDDEYSIL